MTVIVISNPVSRVITIFELSVVKAIHLALDTVVTSSANLKVYHKALPWQWMLLSMPCSGPSRHTINPRAIKIVKQLTK